MYKYNEMAALLFCSILFLYSVSLYPVLLMAHHSEESALGNVILLSRIQPNGNRAVVGTSCLQSFVTSLGLKAFPQRKGERQ